MLFVERRRFCFVVRHSVYWWFSHFLFILPHSLNGVTNICICNQQKNMQSFLILSLPFVSTFVSFMVFSLIQCCFYHLFEWNNRNKMENTTTKSTHFFYWRFVHFFIWQKIKERKFEMHLWAVYWEISLHYVRLRCSRDCNLGYKGMLPLFKVQKFINKSFCWRILLKEIVMNLNLLNYLN